MTEEEAKTKWCPHVSVQLLKQTELLEAGIIDKLDAYPATCMGSDCMMWMQGRPMTEMTAREVTAIKNTGYCGLTK